MAAEVTDQQLINAGIDATNFALFMNGPAAGAGSSVVLRNGIQIPTLAAIIARAEANANGGSGGSGGAIAAITLIDSQDASEWQLTIAGGGIQLNKLS